MKKWILTALAAVFAPFAVHAWQPDGEVTVIVAFKPGTGTDTGARLLAKQAEEYVGAKINVVNIPGAEGILGWAMLATSAPDGRTIGYINLPTFTTLAVLDRAPFTTRDIEPIANHLSEVAVIVVKADSQFKDIDDLICAMNLNPAMKASTNGYKASNHTAVQLFANTAKLGYKPVHYDSTADQISALIDGEVDFTCTKLSDVYEQSKGQDPRFRILAVFSETRDPSIPKVPTLAEKDLYPFWYGSSRALAAPAGTPKEIIDFYENAFEMTLTNPKNYAEHRRLGLVIDFKNRKELKKLIEVQEKFAKDYIRNLYD